MKEDIPEYSGLIRHLRRMPKQDPGDDFTGQVMARIALNRETAWSRLLRMLPVRAVRFPGRQPFPQKATSRGECAFYFFLTGFFYLVMAVFLAAGFGLAGEESFAADWLGLQPYLTFATALWLLLLGLLLRMDGFVAAAAARYGTFLYMAFIVLNGMMIRPYFNASHAGLLIGCFVAAGLCLGLMLVLAVHKLEWKAD